MLIVRYDYDSEQHSYVRFSTNPIGIFLMISLHYVDPIVQDISLFVSRNIPFFFSNNSLGHGLTVGFTPP